MEVKAGYKQTDSGIIPNDWECRKLNELAGYVNGKAQEGSIKDSGKYVVVNSKFIASDGEVKKYSDVCLCEAKVGDVLMVLSDVPNGRAIAKCFLVNEKDKYSVNQRICLLSPRGIDGRLLFYKLNRNPHFISFDDGVKQTNLRKQDVLNCPIGFPQSQAEQQAIANALSDADALIESLEQLIEKKRQIKQGVMQELLTGKRRLPGFSGEWESRSLGEIAQIQRGASPRPIESPIWFDDKSQIGWVRISDITKAGMFLKETTQRLSAKGVANSRPVQKDRLIMSICATVGRPIITEIDVCIHDGFVVFENLRADKKFVYYVLKQIEPDWAKHGQTGSQMNLNTGLINQTRFLHPPIDEQCSIGNFLFDLDSELLCLEERRTKSEKIKQAMMQELLTGKVRLV